MGTIESVIHVLNEVMLQSSTSSRGKIVGRVGKTPLPVATNVKNVESGVDGQDKESRNVLPEATNESEFEDQLEDTGSQKGITDLVHKESLCDEVGNLFSKNELLQDNQDDLCYQGNPDTDIENQVIHIESGSGVIIGNSLEKADRPRSLQLVNVSTASHLRSTHTNLSLKFRGGIQIHISGFTHFVIFDVNNFSALDDSIETSENIFRYIRHLR